VRAFGIRRGLVLTIDRLSRCRGGVPLGSSDPIPKQ
jgi:putative component of membrane protein insertase Oxa1/YidC/SpoIIIJ protein YidD